MPKVIDGGCLCGEVKFRVSEPFHSFYLCHCTRCRKLSGSAHASNLFSKLNSVTWMAGAEFRVDYEYSNNSFFNACFCKRCGSPVPRRAKSGEFMIVPAGSLNESPSVVPTENIFWADRAEWYEAGCDAPKRDGY